MLRAKINAMLRSLLGNDIEMIDRWYNSPNKAFDGKCPLRVPKQDLYIYLLEFFK